MYQRRGLQDITQPFIVHVGVSDLLQFMIDQRNQLRERLRVTPAPGLQQPCDFVRAHHLWYADYTGQRLAKNRA